MRNFPRKAHCRAWVLVAAMAASLFSACAPAQSVDETLDQSYHEMYNLQFDEALKKADQAKTIDKSDPLPWMAEASAVLFREFDRLNILNSEMFTSDEKFAARSAQSWDAASKKQFEDALAAADKP